MKYILLVLLIVQSSQTTAQRSFQTQLDSFFYQLEKKGKGMGSVSLFENGSEVYQKTIGYADLEQKIKPDANTRYRIGSVTKTFTATIIMQLVDEKKIKPETKLREYFPEIPFSGQITIAQMLRHGSGLRDKNYLNWRFKGKKLKLEQQSGYANVNYILLAEIAEKIEKKTFNELLYTRIFEPCSLKNTYYGAKPDSVTHEAWSYRKPPHWVRVPSNDLTDSAGAGGIVSTPTDINLFYYHLFAGKLVSPGALQEMEKTISGYGMGMMKVNFKNEAGFSHSGGIDAFESTAIFFPGKNIGLTYISNGTVMPVNDILIAILMLFLDIG
jgi:D-alanyl-D-alanine carboxypeptidase